MRLNGDKNFSSTNYFLYFCFKRDTSCAALAISSDDNNNSCADL